MKKPAPFGKYYLLERINVGGMAEVFRAKAFGVEGFERLVAVKRILPNIAEDKEFIRMFIEEAKLAVQLNHANIAQIFDLGVVDGAYYIALEHVHGRDLRGIFDRNRQQGEPMPIAQACFVVMKVCEGLDYAHNKRDQSGRELSLVHRDVSPQNVLVSFEGEVKLIDFGIAKAAGKGSKTQAGILKGKFGYMSPEQVRGLPIDRRSDVFSAGIVLYELLTGERLFVGESDFSTLEKVRNVEILPPSTYNRRIPDELERIVLKALAKDVDDRYQNAIDLHDELQAFVYTAGEFYSRKDLAGWMKKTFAKEIEDETAKLETYRQLKPPPTPDPATAVPRTLTGRGTGPSPAIAPALARPSKPLISSVAAVSSAGLKPPPPPRASGQMAVVTAPVAKVASAKGRTDESGALAWDDDELETQIYDNDDDPRAKKPGARPSSPDAPSPATTSRGMGAASDIPSLASAASASASQTMTHAAPDLSSLVQPAKGWTESGPSPSPAATVTGLGAFGAGTNGANGASRPSSPLPADTREPLFDSKRSIDRSAPFDPMASFGSGITKQAGNKRGLILLVAGGAAAAIAVVVALLAMSGGSRPKPTEAPTTAAVTPTAPTVTTAVGDTNTGFDLYVAPAGVTQWKLDGEARTDRLPSRIRGIAPGEHAVSIEPPPGFLSHTQKVVVEKGQASRVEITLSPVDGIHGTFESMPPGATVSLIIDGKRETLGPSPAKAPLDPRKSYQVLFEKPGYVSVNRPVVFSGGLEEKVIVPLEKAGGAVAAVAPVVPEVKTPEVKTPEVKAPKVDRPVTKPDRTEPKTAATEPKVEKTEPKPDAKVGNDTKAAPSGTGMLMLGSKPSCEIYVDGSNTGLHTPQRAMKLSAGKHRITLINNEFGIKETFTVDVKPDETAKAIKDYSDRLPQ